MKIKIVFGTELGITGFVAQLMKTQLSDLGHTVTVFQADRDGYDPKLTDEDLILFGSPTYYGNKPAFSMSTFMERFELSLASYKIGLFILGDSGYPSFCGASVTMENWLASRQGQLVTKTLKLNGYPTDPSLTKKWLEELIESVKNFHAKNSV